MNIRRAMLRSPLAVGIACYFMLPLFQTTAADAPPQVPDIVQKGFASWAEKNAASWAMDVWKVGGLMESDSKPGMLSRYFGRLDQSIGNYKSYEAIDAKQIGRNSQILYLAVHFERAAIYGRFLLYRTDKGWVVQNMDFSAAPEAIMPWLAFTGVNYGE
jgi:hypothetical protein